MKMKSKYWLISIAAFLLVVVGLVLVVRQWRAVARKNWKEQAIPEITRLADDSNWVSKEISIIKSSVSGENKRITGDVWIRDNILLMANGEWLVYKSHCSKAKPHSVADIFIAKGSDGKWYYSTFHFCMGMVGLRGMGQPESLQKFAADYSLREFDGHSDECLQKTWPPENR